ncbi:MAG: aryl-sulfate sulfotransferase [bacterium]
MNDRLCLMVLCAGTVLLAACDGHVTDLAPLPAVRAVSADTTADDHIVLHVQPNAPAVVSVVYWNDPAHKLMMRTEAPAAGVALVLQQLRPGLVYQYDVAALSISGEEGKPIHGSVGVPALVGGLRELSISATGAMSEPLVMLEVGGTFKGFVAVNSAGEPVWHWATRGTPQGFTRRANGNFVFIDAGYGLFEVTPQGQVVHELDPLANGDRAPHHDVIATASNTLLFIAQETRTVATDVLGSTLVAGEAIWEWNPESGSLVKRWSAFDFYDPAVDRGTRSVASDWLHGNSLSLGDHGNVILSLNWLSQVVSIAPDWKSLEWRIGGRGSSVVLDSNAVFQGQHTASVLPNGHLLVFDNGRDGAAHHSRAAEIAFDLKAGSGHLVWSFSPASDQYDPYVGAARRLPNGNTFVYFGIRDGFAGAVGPMAGYEVTSDGRIVWHATVNGGDISYRGTPISSLAGEIAVP